MEEALERNRQQEREPVKLSEPTKENPATQLDATEAKRQEEMKAFLANM